MAFNIRGWILSGSLSGALVLGMGAVAQAQYAYEAPPGARADQREDWREARRLRGRIEWDQRQLDADIYRFGKHSPEARADRERLRYDRQRLKALRRDMHRHNEIREDGWR